MVRTVARIPPSAAGCNSERLPSVRINWKLPGWAWVKTTGEAAGVTFTLAVYDAWQDSPNPDLLSVPWGRAFSHGSYYAIGVMLYGVLGIPRANGVWSWIKSVVARDETEPQP